MRAVREPVDVLLVSLGSTTGWRAADAELAESMRRAGASVAVVAARAQRPVRTFMLTDLGWSRASRAAARDALDRYAPRATIYSTTTAALLWPTAGAIRFDALAAENRPGRHGLWQRPLERRRLADSPLLLPMSEGALGNSAAVLAQGRSLVLPMPVEPSGAVAAERDIAALTYAGNPEKKGTARVLEAWCRARRGAEELVVAGCTPEQLERAGVRLSREELGIRLVGALPADAYRALLRRARVFVCAPRREDYGIAQLEALADGCMLVTAPAPGPYPALAIARELDSRLVGDDLASAVRSALDAPEGEYRLRAERAISSFRREAIDDVVARELLPRLLADARACASS